MVYTAKTVKTAKLVMLMKLTIVMNVMMALVYRHSQTKNMVIVFLMEWISKIFKILTI